MTHQRCSVKWPQEADSLLLLQLPRVYPKFNRSLSRRFQGKMLANGWCAHQVKHLSKIHTNESFSALSTLQRSAQRLVDHNPCLNHTACVAFNADMATYSTKHVDPGCTCRMVPTPYQRLISTIRRGDIPLLSIEGNPDSDSTYELKVHARSRNSKYIAISHVWFDGLGNPNENSLPLCQLKRLEANLLSLGEVLKEYRVSTLY